MTDPMKDPRLAEAMDPKQLILSVLKGIPDAEWGFPVDVPDFGYVADEIFQALKWAKCNRSAPALGATAPLLTANAPRWPLPGVASVPKSKSKSCG